jgi:predicted permease
LVRLHRVDPGFDAHRVLAVRVSLPRARYGDPRSIKLFLDRAVQAIETDPVVESHSAISVLPLSGGMSTVPFIVASRPPSARDQRPSANYRAIAPRYFATMGIPILEGTEFSDADRAGTRAVAIVNRQFARRFLGGLQATGTRLRIDDTDNGEREAVIVAVVGDVKQNSLDDEPAPDLYVPIEQLPKENTRFVTNGMTLVLRCRTEPRQIGGAVKGRVLAAEPEAALTPRAMDELLAASLATRRFQTLLMNLFGAFAAFLAGFGLYACMSCLTSERHHEIGVRLAVGATRTEIAGLVMKQGLTLAACGTAVGIALALLGHRLLSGLLFGTGPFDAIALGTAAGGVFAIAAAASWLPAVRAARIDPVTMLRR